MENVEKSKVLDYMRSITPKRIADYHEFTVADWNDYWLCVCCKGIKETTYRSYESISENHIKPVLGNIMLCKLSNEDVQLFINSLNLGIGLEEPLSAKTIKNIHGTLHKCLEVAKNNRYIDVNPADKIILPVIEHFEMHSLTEEEINIFIKCIKGHEKEYLYLVAMLCGLREGEIIGLTWDCVNLEDGYLHVYRQLVRKKNTNGSGQHYEFGSLKNNKARNVYLCNTAQNIFLKLKENATSSKTNDFVFLNSKGEHYTHCAIYNALQKIIKASGLPHFRFHDLRHTYATLSIKAGVDIKTLQYNLGHYTAAFTLDCYGHCDEDSKRRNANKMQDIIKDFNIN